MIHNDDNFTVPSFTQYVTIMFTLDFFWPCCGIGLANEKWCYICKVFSYLEMYLLRIDITNRQM